MRVQEIIRRPLITEKSTEMRETTGIVAFEVHRDANKIQVKRAVETQFKVKVAEVRVANCHGKVRRQGLRPAGRRREADRVLRGDVNDADQAEKTVYRVEPFPDAPDLRRDHSRPA